MTDETIKVLEELRGIVNNFTIRGPGVAGNIKTGWTVNPGSGQMSSGTPRTAPPPSITGACCPEDGDCFIATQSVCEGGGGTYQGDDTVCDPNPCPNPADMGCCLFEDHCDTILRADCTGIFVNEGYFCWPEGDTTGVDLKSCCLDGDVRCIFEDDDTLQYFCCDPGQTCCDTDCCEEGVACIDCGAFRCCGEGCCG